MFYIGSASKYGLLGLADELESKRNLENLAKRNDISIGEIAREAMIVAIDESDVLPLASESEHDAVLSIEITQFGLMVPHGFASVLKPVIDVTAEIIDSHGRVMWRDEADIGSMAGDMPAHDYDTIMGDPEKLRMLWAAAARHVSIELVESMGPAE